MSQSPIDDFSDRSVTRYRQGWKALNRLLHEDRSFSGQEKNCVFLNTAGQHGGGRFADISAASGLDFADDGRAVALCDWDFDGDLDLWITNRTAPRIRLLRNDGTREHHFLALKLRGDGQQTNRDAIGARVEVVLGGNQRPLVKTLHAGDGFLSQSSRWLFFGLGDATEIQHVVVRWPGGEPRRYANLLPDRHYLIDQPSGKAEAWSAPTNRKQLVATAPLLPEPSGAARIVLPSRLLLPTLRTAGSDEPLNRRIARPTLLSLWSATCTACVRDLEQFSMQSERLRRADLNVMAINLDNLEGDAEAADRILNSIGFPFTSESGTTDLVRSLDVLRRAVLDRWATLTVPSSFLIDRQGRVAVMYQGELNLDQVLSDLALLNVPAQRLRTASTPFAGRWIMPAGAADPLRVTSQFIDEAMVASGLEYLQRYADATTDSSSATEAHDAGDVFFILAILLREQDQLDESLMAFERALTYHPDDFRFRSDFASLLAQIGKLDRAAEQLLEALRINPQDIGVQRKLAFIHMQQGDPSAAIKRFTNVLKAQRDDVASWYNLANAYRAAGQLENALKLYRHTVKIEPGMTLAANNLAWILATHPNAELRDGQQAVTWAERVCAQSDHGQPGFLDTLACAYAERGDFEKAVATAAKALQLSTEKGDTDGAREIQGRLKLFQQKKPFRDDVR